MSDVQKTQNHYQTYLGKVNFEGEKAIFVSDSKKSIPVTLSDVQEKLLKQNPDRLVILKEKENLPYLYICNKQDIVEKRTYMIYVTKSTTKEEDKFFAGLKTFSQPTYDKSIVEDFIKANPQNEVAVTLCLRTDKGRFVRIENSTFMPKRKNGDKLLSESEYLEKIGYEVGKRINQLKNKGFEFSKETTNIVAFYSNIEFMKYNSMYTSNNEKQLLNAYNRQTESQYGRFNVGYIPFSKSKENTLFANAIPLNSLYINVKDPMFIAGKTPTQEEIEKFKITEMEKILLEEKENQKAFFANKKEQEVILEQKTEEQESNFCPTM